MECLAVQLRSWLGPPWGRGPRPETRRARAIAHEPLATLVVAHDGGQRRGRVFFGRLGRLRAVRHLLITLGRVADDTAALQAGLDDINSGSPEGPAHRPGAGGRRA